MAELATLARPYARAAFEAALAQGEDALPEFSYQLALLTACVQEPSLRAELTSPHHVASEKADLIRQILADDLAADGSNFVTLLAEQSRLELLPEIQMQFEQQRANYEKVLKVEVVSAREMGDAETRQLEERLGRRFQHRVEMSVRTDPMLLGGAVIRAGDTVIDGSIRGRLVRLAESLGVTRDRRVRADSTTPA